jgi:hypothetical protein
MDADNSIDPTELARFRTFMKRYLRGSRHPDTRIGLMHVYANYLEWEKKKHNEVVEIQDSSEQESFVPDLSLPVKLEPLKLSCHSKVKSEFQGDFILPGEVIAHTRKCFLIGFFLNGTDALMVMVDQQSSKRNYYPFICLTAYLDETNLAGRGSGPSIGIESFLKSLKNIDDYQSHFDFKFDSTIRNSKDSFIVTDDGEFDGQFCNESLCYSLNNGLIFRNANSGVNTFYIVDEGIWFEENKQQKVEKLYDIKIKDIIQCQDFILTENNSRIALEIAMDIARTRKFRLSTRVKSVKGLMKIVNKVGCHVVTPTELDKCLLFLLSGTDSMKEIGTFMQCKGGHNTCTCDVEISSKAVDASLIKTKIQHKRKTCSKTNSHGAKSK